MALWTLQSEFQPGTIQNVCFKCKTDLRKKSPTGQPGHEHALDTGVMVDFEGVVAFCESCIVEAAGLIGLITPQKAAELRHDRDLEEAYAEELRRRLEIAEAAIDILRRLPEQV